MARTTTRDEGDMRYLSRDPVVIQELHAVAQKINTVHDLKLFLREFRSPAVGAIILPAVEFFSTGCRNTCGESEWKVVRERRQMGVTTPLRDDQSLTLAMLDGLLNWMLSPQHGRYLGTTLWENLCAEKEGLIEPRAVAFDLLFILKERLRE